MPLVRESHRQLLAYDLWQAPTSASFGEILHAMHPRIGRPPHHLLQNANIARLGFEQTVVSRLGSLSRLYLTTSICQQRDSIHCNLSTQSRLKRQRKCSNWASKRVIPPCQRSFNSGRANRDANSTSDSMGRKDLPSAQEGRRSQLAKRLSHLMDNMQTNVFIAGQRLNDLTGYTGIEALKKEIEDQGLLDS